MNIQFAIFHAESGHAPTGPEPAGTECVADAVRTSIDAVVAQSSTVFEDIAGKCRYVARFESENAIDGEHYMVLRKVSTGQILATGYAKFKAVDGEKVRVMN